MESKRIQSFNGKSVRLSPCETDQCNDYCCRCCSATGTEAADILAAKGVSARVIDIMAKADYREIILKAADETKLIMRRTTISWADWEVCR